MSTRPIRLPRPGELPDFHHLPPSDDPTRLRASHDEDREIRTIPSRLTQDVADLSRTNAIGAL